MCLERKQVPKAAAPGRTPPGFTLIELLVVISVIAILLAIMLPALARVREQARCRTCAAHIRQQFLALYLYGSENMGRLPLTVFSGQDRTGNLFHVTVNAMLRNGATRESFYCPSNALHQKYKNHLWTASSGGRWNGIEFEMFNSIGGTISSSYGLLVTHRHAIPPIEPTPYARDSGRKTWVGSLQDRHAATRELVVDLIVGASDPNRRSGYDFVDAHKRSARETEDSPLVREYVGTNHVRSGNPTGGNIGFLDGHIEWRRFDPDIDPSGVAVPRYRSGERFYFW